MDLGVGWSGVACAGGKAVARFTLCVSPGFLLVALLCCALQVELEAYERQRAAKTRMFASDYKKALKEQLRLQQNQVGQHSEHCPSPWPPIHPYITFLPLLGLVPLWVLFPPFSALCAAIRPQPNSLGLGQFRVSEPMSALERSINTQLLSTLPTSSHGRHRRCVTWRNLLGRVLNSSCCLEPVCYIIPTLLSFR